MGERLILCRRRDKQSQQSHLTTPQCPTINVDDDLDDAVAPSIRRCRPPRRRHAPPLRRGLVLLRRAPGLRSAAPPRPGAPPPAAGSRSAASWSTLTLSGLRSFSLAVGTGSVSITVRFLTKLT